MVENNQDSEKESKTICSTQQLIDYHDRMWHGYGGEGCPPPLMVIQKQYDRLASIGFPSERMIVIPDELPIAQPTTDCDPYFYYISIEFVHQYQGNSVLLMGNISHVNINVCHHIRETRKQQRILLKLGRT